MNDRLAAALQPAAVMPAGTAVTAFAALWLSRRLNGPLRRPFSAR